MDLRILGWDSKNMRCPDATLRFNRDDRIDFLQMNNGTGKTTTLILIKMALSGEKDIIKLGEAVEPSAKSKNDLPDNLHSLLRNEKDHGKFILYTLINDQKYTFEIEINRLVKSKEAAQIYTIAREIKGKNTGWLPPSEAKPFLSLHFVNIFVFNGENASGIFEKNNDYAKKTISTLCQFNILEEAQDYAEAYLRLKIAEVGRSSEKGVGTRFENLLDMAEKKLQECKDERKELSDLIKKDQVEYNKLDEKIGAKINENEDNNSKREKIQNNIDKNSNSIINIRKNIYADLINPAKINKSTISNLIKFKKDLSHLKLPDNAARSFFIELSAEKECICRRPIGPEEKEAIKNNADLYLDDSTVSILNALKTSISLYEKAEPSNLQENFKELNEADMNAAKFETEKTRLITKIGDEDEEFRSDVERYGYLKGEIEKQNNILAEYDEPAVIEDVQKGLIHDDLINIETIKKIVEKYKIEVSKVNKTVSLKKATDLFKEILSSVIVRSRKVITDGIHKMAQKEIDKILTEANPKIIIKKIDNYVELDRPGTGVPLSMGQRLAAAYIFMSAALGYSNTSVPFIVDSPTGALDDVNREGIGQAIPNISEQFITFIQPAERPIFYSHARLAAENKCSHATIFWLTKRNKDWLNKYSDEIEAKDKKIYDDWGMVMGHKHMANYNLSEEAKEFKG